MVLIQLSPGHNPPTQHWGITMLSLSEFIMQIQTYWGWRAIWGQASTTGWHNLKRLLYWDPGKSLRVRRTGAWNIREPGAKLDRTRIHIQIFMDQGKQGFPLTSLSALWWCREWYLISIATLINGSRSPQEMVRQPIASGDGEAASSEATRSERDWHGGHNILSNIENTHRLKLW